MNVAAIEEYKILSINFIEGPVLYPFEKGNAFLLTGFFIHTQIFVDEIICTFVNVLKYVPGIFSVCSSDNIRPSVSGPVIGAGRFLWRNSFYHVYEFHPSREIEGYRKA